MAVFRVFRFFLILLLVLAALGAGVFLLLPWKTMLASKLAELLEAQGFKHVTMLVQDAGPKNLVLRDISVGEKNPLILENLDIGYSLRELLDGRLQEITLKGLTIAAAQAPDGGWNISGIERGDPNAKTIFKIPVTTQELAIMPLERIALENGRLNVRTAVLEFSTPLNVKWQTAPAQLSYTADALTAKMNGMNIAASHAEAAAELDETAKKWTGTWQVKQVQLSGTDMPLPPMDGSGTITATAERISLKGGFKSPDGQTRADFSLDLAPNTPLESKLVITQSSLPWNGGTVAVKNVNVPLNGKRDIKLNVEVQKISLDTLLQTLTDKRASGSGLVSGTIPVTLKADGGLMIDKGALNGEGPGTITMTPETIPGDNEQVALVRDILKNLQYKVLAASANTGPNNTLDVTLSLEGHNPDVYNGKPVKLNVHLTGDVLNFIQQGVMSLIDPKVLLKQIKNEKK